MITALFSEKPSVQSDGLEQIAGWWVSYTGARPTEEQVMDVAGSSDRIKKKRLVQRIKQECERRIYDRYPLHKQLKHRDNKEMRAWIDAMTARSNELEESLAEDFADDGCWQVQVPIYEMVPDDDQFEMPRMFIGQRPLERQPAPPPIPAAIDLSPVMEAIGFLQRRNDELEALVREYGASMAVQQPQTIERFIEVRDEYEREQIKYETALRALNGNVEAMELLKPVADKLSLSVSDVAGDIIAARKERERQVMAELANSK